MRIRNVYGGPTEESIGSKCIQVCLLLTFYLFFDWLGWVDPMTDVVVVGVLEAEVILLDDVHLVVHLLHQLLPRRFLLQRKDDELKLKTITQRFFDVGKKEDRAWLMELRRRSMLLAVCGKVRLVVFDVHS